jgi:protocatechuate 3,4-dioxygenase beta subunit
VLVLLVQAFRVDAFNHPQLTTQMYFSDEAAYNDADFILRKTEKGRTQGKLVLEIRA